MRTAVLPAVIGVAVLAVRPAAASEESLADAVPADVGLFAELHGASDLLTALTEPRLWSTLAELAGQPAQPEDTARWRQRVRQTVRMEPEEAIRVLFARGVAFIGEGLGRTQDAVVVCRPAAHVSTEELLRRWNARALAEPRQPPTYRLAGNIGVAVIGDRLSFGDLGRPAGMLARMQRFASTPGARSLAEDPAYRRLRARIAPNPDGLLFLRLGRAAPLPVPQPPSRPASQPVLKPALPRLPGALRGADNILIALHREGSLLHFSAVGDGGGNQPALGPRAVQLLERLPERTLFAWEGPIVYSELAEAINRLPEEHPVRGVFQLPQQREALDSFLKALDVNTCVAVGLVFPAGRGADAPPLPAAALLVATRDPVTVGRQVRNVVNAGMASYCLFAFARGLPLLEPIQQTTIGRARVSVLDLSPLLKPTAKAAIGEAHLCWALHDRVLIIASHVDWLRQIIAAREGRAPDFTRVTRLSRARLTSSAQTAVVLQSGPIADLGTRWLAYLRRTRPEVFEERWWRGRQPGGGAVLLGITVMPEPQQRRLRIVEVLEDRPADGWLKIGDYVVGCSGKTFSSDDPLLEMRRAIDQRPHARWLDVLIERDGTRLTVRLPLPFINPVEMLERLSAIGKVAQRAVYADDLADPAGPRGLLTIELRSSPQPLFEFAPPVPISAETTRPTQ